MRVIVTPPKDEPGGDAAASIRHGRGHLVRVRARPARRAGDRRISDGDAGALEADDLALHRGAGGGKLSSSRRGARFTAASPRILRLARMSCRAREIGVDGTGARHLDEAPVRALIARWVAVVRSGCGAVAEGEVARRSARRGRDRRWAVNDKVLRAAVKKGGVVGGPDGW